MAQQEEKFTDFGQFIISSIGPKFIHAELIGSLKLYKARLVRNAAIADVKVDETVYLRVRDISVKSKYGTDVVFEPIARVTDPIEIQRFIIKDRKRIASIFMKAAEENFSKGWFTGAAIDKALLFCASHVDLKQEYYNLRLMRLNTQINACRKYEWKLSEKYVDMARSTLKVYNDEKALAELDLSNLEARIKAIQTSLLKAEKHLSNKSQEHLSAIKKLLRQNT